MAARKKKPAKGSGRDGSGRFKRGNPGGPGNPYAKAIAAFRRVGRDAFTPKQIEEALAHLFAVGTGKASRIALDREGNEVELPPTFTEQVAALRVLFERVMGKPREAEIAIDFPEVRTAEDLPAASAAILDAARRGEISTPDVIALNTTLAGMRAHLADAEFHRRLVAIEQAQAEG